MFHSASLRLTLWYLAIIMFISVLFSAALYEVSTREIDYGLRPNAPVAIYYLGPEKNEFDNFRENRLEESRDRILVNLMYYNLAILVLGGVASYFLARRTLRPIEEALESQSRFTADASHELRTPLSAMRSEIEVALRNAKLAPKETRELLQSNLEEIDKLTTLSNSLLTLARYHHGLPLDVAQIQVSDFIAAAVRSVEKAAKIKGIKITQKVDAIKVRGDQTMLTELATILLDNAIKYSPAKSEVVISAQIDKHEIMMRVRDQGSGIAATDLPHVFDRFYRADASRSETKGYGLGLSIAQQIVTLHHGQIKIESATDQGTTVVVLLPTEQPKRQSFSLFQDL